MRKPDVKKFSLETIANTLKQLPDLAAARRELDFAVGSVVEVSGTVQKVVKRDGGGKLVIEPGDVPGFVVFADCPGESENLRKHKIRKGTRVTVRGSLAAFGAAAVNLSAVKLQQLATEKKKKNNRKETGDAAKCRT